MTFITLRVLVSLYSRVLVDHQNLILAFWGVVPSNVGLRDLIPYGFAPMAMKNRNRSRDFWPRMKLREDKEMKSRM